VRPFVFFVLDGTGTPASSAPGRCRFASRRTPNVRTIDLPAPADCSTFSAVQLISSLTAMQRLALRWRRQGHRIAFVPTMGYLHSGHVSLAQRARRLAGPRGKVVVSIYVNP